jgi:2-C-methyl-D-erythritol 4-phosphate cytidylyltransferase
LKFTCILVAAGRGLRARSAANKVLVRAGSIPILHYSLKRFAALEECVQIVLVANQENIEQGFFDSEKLAREYRVSKVVEGGERRVDSVRNGLAADDPEVPLVVSHDAARPFVSSQTILAVVREAEQSGAAIAAVPALDTLKVAGPDMLVSKTIARKGLFQAQTPQAFRRELLERAFASVDTGQVTDDAQLIELLGEKVKLVESKTTNLKITTPEDLVLAIKLLPAWDVESE